MRKDNDGHGVEVMAVQGRHGWRLRCAVDRNEEVSTRFASNDIFEMCLTTFLKCC